MLVEGTGPHPAQVANSGRNDTENGDRSECAHIVLSVNMGERPVLRARNPARARASRRRKVLPIKKAVPQANRSEVAQSSPGTWSRMIHSDSVDATNATPAEIPLRTAVER